MTLRIFQWLPVALKEPNQLLLSFTDNELSALIFISQTPQENHHFSLKFVKKPQPLPFQEHPESVACVTRISPSHLPPSLCAFCASLRPFPPFAYLACFAVIPSLAIAIRTVFLSVYSVYSVVHPSSFACPHSVDNLPVLRDSVVNRSTRCNRFLFIL